MRTAPVTNFRLQRLGEHKAKLLCACTEETRKRLIGIPTAILVAGKLAQLDRGMNTPAAICAIDNAIRWAEKIMSEIDRRWPTSSRS